MVKRLIMGGIALATATVLTAQVIIQIERYDSIQELFSRAYNKANSNHDETLQRDELTELLKRIGLDCKVLLDSFTVGYTEEPKSKCYDWLGSTTVELSKSDLEKYLKQ